MSRKMLLDELARSMSLEEIGDAMRDGLCKSPSDTGADALNFKILKILKIFKVFRILTIFNFLKIEDLQDLENLKDSGDLQQFKVFKISKRLIVKILRIF